jgi:arylsulfatase A-like enzyme
MTANSLLNFTLAACLIALAAFPSRASADVAASPKQKNILFVVCDQEAYRINAGSDFVLPARKALQQRGVTFRNHYISSAVCTPSRGVIFTGLTPQNNGVYDHLSFGFVPSLDPKMPSMGRFMKESGYQTAYFGKYELSTKVLGARPTDNTSTWLQPYGFDTYNAEGDFHGRAYDGFAEDPYIAGSAIRWIRTNVPALRKNDQPFFMVMSLVNPHDIMFADANIPGLPAAQKPVGPGLIVPPPKAAIYDRKWDFKLPASLGENLHAPGMPSAVDEYRKAWDGVVGGIPPERKDMWHAYCNYYLNCLRDSDRTLQQVWDALDDMDLWKDTIVVLTADHGDMAGTHGLRGKGALCYENNAHVPLVVAHPAFQGNKSCQALTSHLDLVPTLIAMAAKPGAEPPAEAKKLSGHDFSKLLADPEAAKVDVIRPGVLFNYVSLTTVDADWYGKSFVRMAQRKPPPDLAEIDLTKRGFLSFVFDGRHKLARFFSPRNFNTPRTLDELFKNNDVQVFDLKDDPDEMRNLALEKEKHADAILRLNGLLNDLMAREVGANDGKFLPPALKAK